MTVSDSSTSSSLIQRARQHDPDAWQQIVDLYGPLVYYWCRRSDLNSAAAADVFQEVFASVSRNMETFRHGGPGHTFRGWLWTITRNKIRDYYRQEAVETEAVGGSEALRRLESVPDRWEEGSDDPEETSELRQLYRRALDRVRTEFESKTWQAFWMCIVEGQSTTDVADALGISANAVRQYRSRVLRRLRQELGDMPD